MAKLKRLVNKIEDVDEKYRDLYTKQDDGTWLLDDDDTSFKSKLDEFRTNNREKHKQLEELTAKLGQYKDVDPEQYKKLLELQAELDKDEEGKLIKAGKIDDVFKKRTEAMTNEYNKQVKALREALEAKSNEAGNLRSSLGKHLIDAAATAKLSGVGVIRKGAIKDLLTRARETWIINDKGEMVPFRDGSTAFGKKGDPLTMEEWAANQLEEAPHCFENGEGGGAEGGNKGVGDEGGQKKSVNKNDPMAFGRNLEGIAKGEVAVR